MARTLSKEHLPPGATAYVFQGQIYVPGDDGKVRDTDGREVELPEGFPSDADLKSQRQAAERFAPSAQPLDQTIATTGDAEDAKAKKSARGK